MDLSEKIKKAIEESRVKKEEPKEDNIEDKKSPLKKLKKKEKIVKEKEVSGLSRFIK